MEGVDPRLVQVFRQAIKVSPIDFGIPELGGLRTEEQQKELYALGRTKPGRIVTKADGVNRKSRHQSGRALDVYAYVNKKASWDETHLAIIAGVILSTANRLGYKVKWGGTFGSSNFKGWDTPHFEII